VRSPGSESTEDRLWRQVDRGGAEECWPWTSKSTDLDGRGRLRDSRNGTGRTEYAHRVAWEVANGRRPEGQILHRCNYSACCNPAHLYEGDYILNSQDAVTSGSSKKGAKKRLARNPHGGAAKLSERSASEIRRLYATGQFTQARLGEMFGVDQTNISLVVRNRIWSS
jgi:hypothetical protein